MLVSRSFDATCTIRHWKLYFWTSSVCLQLWHVILSSEKTNDFRHHSPFGNNTRFWKSWNSIKSLRKVSSAFASPFHAVHRHWPNFPETRTFFDATNKGWSHIFWYFLEIRKFTSLVCYWHSRDRATVNEVQKGSRRRALFVRMILTVALDCFEFTFQRSCQEQIEWSTLKEFQVLQGTLWRNVPEGNIVLRFALNSCHRDRMYDSLNIEPVASEWQFYWYMLLGSPPVNQRTQLRLTEQAHRGSLCSSSCVKDLCILKEPSWRDVCGNWFCNPQVSNKALKCVSAKRDHNLSNGTKRITNSSQKAKWGLHRGCFWGDRQQNASWAALKTRGTMQNRHKFQNINICFSSLFWLSVVRNTLEQW